MNLAFIPNLASKYHHNLYYKMAEIHVFKNNAQSNSLVFTDWYPQWWSSENKSEWWNWNDFTGLHLQFVIQIRTNDQEEEDDQQNYIYKEHKSRHKYRDSIIDSRLVT